MTEKCHVLEEWTSPWSEAYHWASAVYGVAQGSDGGKASIPHGGRLWKGVDAVVKLRTATRASQDLGGGECHEVIPKTLEYGRHACWLAKSRV